MNVRKLKAAMIMAGYDQRKLAAEIGMTPTTFSRKLNGKSSFDIDHIISICNILNIDNDLEKSHIFLSKMS